MKRVFLLVAFVFTLSYPSNAQNIEPITKVTQKLKVFPNPATNVVNILGLQNSTKATITVSDTYGNTVLKHHWTIKNNAINIPINKLISGIYIVTIRSQEQQIQTKFYKK